MAVQAGSRRKKCITISQYEKRNPEWINPLTEGIRTQLRMDYAADQDIELSELTAILKTEIDYPLTAIPKEQHDRIINCQRGGKAAGRAGDCTCECPKEENGDDVYGDHCQYQSQLNRNPFGWARGPTLIASPPSLGDFVYPEDFTPPVVEETPLVEEASPVEIEGGVDEIDMNPDPMNGPSTGPTITGYPGSFGGISVDGPNFDIPEGEEDSIEPEYDPIKPATGPTTTGFPGISIPTPEHAPHFEPEETPTDHEIDSEIVTYFDSEDFGLNIPQTQGWPGIGDLTDDFIPDTDAINGDEFTGVPGEPGHTGWQGVSGDPDAITFHPDMDGESTTYTAPIDPIIEETGGEVDTEIDECSMGTHDCKTGTFCVNVSFAEGGYKCQDVDECKLGIDSCGPNSTCVNTFGSYLCQASSSSTADNTSQEATDSRNNEETGTQESYATPGVALQSTHIILIIFGSLFFLVVALFCLYTNGSCWRNSASITPGEGDIEEQSNESLSSMYSTYQNDWLDEIPSSSSDESEDADTVPTIIVISSPGTPRYLDIPEHY